MWARREARAEPVEDSLGAAITADDHLVLVGELDGVALGYAVARVDALRDGSSVGVVEDLYVERGAREIGLGEALMDGVIEWCRARGLHGRRLPRAAGQPRDEELLRVLRPRRPRHRRAQTAA